MVGSKLQDIVRLLPEHLPGEALQRLLEAMRQGKADEERSCLRDCCHDICNYPDYMPYRPPQPARIPIIDEKINVVGTFKNNFKNNFWNVLAMLDLLKLLSYTHKS